MAAEMSGVARELFEGVMAPLVLGGEVRPGHAIGARQALALTQAAGAQAVDTALFDRVQRARIRRARRLLPVDALDPATDAEWALCAAWHDTLQAANPTFDGTLRRSMATRILDLAIATLDQVPAPATAGEALSRHTWFARAMELRRTDTSVSWWSGSRTYRGAPPPLRLQAWPGIRRVSVIERRTRLVELTPLAVDREQLTRAVSLLLDRSPLTAIAACTRTAPRFAWSGGSLALVATRAGCALALRALEALPEAEVDAALGRATRSLLELRRDLAGPALRLLSERALAEVAGHLPPPTAGTPHEALLARALGAVVARSRLENGEAGWPEPDRRRLLDGLASVVSGVAGQSAVTLLQGWP